MTPLGSRVLLITNRYTAEGVHSGMTGRVVSDLDDSTCDIELTNEMRQRVALVSVRRGDVVFLPEGSLEASANDARRGHTSRDLFRAFLSLSGLELEKFSAYLKQLPKCHEELLDAIESHPELLDSHHTGCALFIVSDSGSLKAADYARRHEHSPDVAVSSIASAVLDEITRRGRQ